MPTNLDEQQTTHELYTPQLMKYYLSEGVITLGYSTGVSKPRSIGLDDTS